MPYWLESTWISIGYMILAVEAKGLSSLTYTPSETGFLNALLDIPKDYCIVAILPIGFSEEKQRSKPKRKNITQLVFKNRFGEEVF